MSFGVGHSLGSDLTLLWLWCRPAAVAPIGPLAWEPSHAEGAALKRKKKKQLKGFPSYLAHSWCSVFVKDMNDRAKPHPVKGAHCAEDVAGMRVREAGGKCPVGARGCQKLGCDAPRGWPGSCP